MSIRIGSFNLHNAGQNAKPDKLKMIARIIEQENFDIVALQEVFCPYPHIITAQTLAPPVSTILQNIGKNKTWKGYFTAPRQARNAKEGYAFLWNTQKVDLPRSIARDGSVRIYYPRIFDINCRGTELERNPLVGRFVFTDGQFGELRIINTHIRFSSKANVDSDNTNGNDVDFIDKNMRRTEFNKLTKKIYPSYSDRIFGADESGDSRPFYTIMLGDYNLNLKRNWTESPYITEEVFELEDNKKGEQKIIQTFQEGLTTLKKITEENEEEYKDHQKYANNYDHSTYETNRFNGKGMKVQTKIVDAIRKYDNSDFVHYRKEISDHIPICVEIDTK